MLIEYYIKSKLGQAYHDNECKKLDRNMVNDSFVDFTVRSKLKLQADMQRMETYLTSKESTDIPKKVESHDGKDCLLDDEITINDLSSV